MATPYVTGPALIYVGQVVPVAFKRPAAPTRTAVTGGGNQLINQGGGATSVSLINGPFVFLGTAEVSPRIEVRPAWDPIFNDLGGKIPFDLAYQGEEAFTSVTLTRWNEAVFAALQNRGNYQSLLRGFDGPYDIGTLALAEAANFATVVLFPFSAKQYYSANGMPPGYRFLQSVLEGPDVLDPLGTRARKIQLLMHHLRYFNPTNFSFTLYDHNVAGMPAAN